jgi:hypothetical protein
VEKVNTESAGASQSRVSAIRRRLLRKCAPGSRLLEYVLALTASLLVLIAYPQAQEAHPTESQVEAAYLYNFGKFVRWPTDRSAALDSFAICILGKDPFGAVLDATVAGESIDGKKITVSRLSSIQEAIRCSVLFVDPSEQGRLGAILASAQRLSVLTVSDIPHFAERGGVIGLVAQQGKIRFEVNRGSAEDSHLILSSELLKVATKVIEKRTPGN